MPDSGIPVLPADLPRLRTPRTWHALWAAEIDRVIAVVELREREERRGEQARPPVPDWVMEHGIGVGAPVAAVHIGGCCAAGDRLKVISREQAQGALAEGIRVCTHCRADIQLGML